MARNVTYSVSPRINPRDKDAAPKYYGHVQASGDINIREMSERIQATCTVHKSDVYAVLVALEDVITDALKAGEIVRLGDLGTLQIGISSKGAATEDDFSEDLILKAPHQLPTGFGSRRHPHQPDLRQGEAPLHQGRQGSGRRGGGGELATSG